MIFNKQEKVFSLNRIANSDPSRDITTLFEEFYCFLLIAGLFREGEGVEGVHVDMVRISDPQFGIPKGSYTQGTANLIAKGIKSRYNALKMHPSINENELSILSLLDRLFDRNQAWTLSLNGSDLYGISLYRNFNPTMQTIARYVSVMFGRTTYPEPTSVPALYLSALGNIHLSLENTVILSNPEIPYGSKLDNGTQSTALWALLSAQIVTLLDSEYPGDTLGDMLTNLVFLNEACDFEGSIPAPSFASSLYMRRVIGLDNSNPVAVSAAFYQSFLYGSCDKRVVSRQAVLSYLLDLMVKKSDDAVFDLFSPNSYFKKLRCSNTFKNQAPPRPAILDFALEALDSSDVDSDDTPSTDDTETDPQTEDGGYDPTAPAPVTTEAEAPVAVNTIGLISFDKSGEGVDEELYRSTVVALNDRLRTDDKLPVAADVREALDYWVNGFLYRTAISSTKDYISALKLQRYLK